MRLGGVPSLRRHLHRVRLRRNEVRIEELVRNAWRMLDAAREQELPYVVTPSMPILYFGNLPAYRSSPLRVVTVGLNPSRLEFPKAGPWSRFPAAARLDADEKEFVRHYLAALDS
jgi:hypothetical protein